MRRNNHQYKVGDKILVNRKKKSKHELEFMVPFPITQINDNGMVHFQKVIFNAKQWLLFALPNVFPVGNMINV